LEYYNNYDARVILTVSVIITIITYRLPINQTIMITLDDYRKIVGDEKIDEIIKEAKPLRGKYVVHVNSTFYGGGVAEILDSLVYLMNHTGIKAGWRLIKGTPPFFEITKSFHNGCQGAKTKLTAKIRETYEGTSYHNSTIMHLEKNDAVIIHDPQILPLIKFYKKQQPWIWRCHIDITEPNGKNIQRKLKRSKVRIDWKKYLRKQITIPSGGLLSERALQV